MTIGQSIKKARTNKGFTRKDLSEASGICYITLSHWEENKATPTIILLICIADALGISLDELVGRTVANDA